MTDKWTMGSNNEGLYNGINPSCRKGETKEGGRSINNYSLQKNGAIPAF